MSIPKDSHLTRFHFQNPNGISLGHDTESGLEHAKRMHCDHLVLPEINLDTHQRWVRGRLHEHCRRIYGAGQYRSVMTNSTHTYHTAYKPGGLLSVTTGRLTGRILESGSDPMGRWVYTKFSASGANVVTVIGIYQPTAQRVDTARPTTVTAQQFSLLKQESRSQPHKVRKHYSQDLLKFVKGCKQNGELICIGGDLNETLGDDPDGLTKLGPIVAWWMSITTDTK